MKNKFEFYSDDEEDFYKDTLRKYEALRARRKSLSRNKNLTEEEKFELEWNKPVEQSYKRLLRI